MDEWLEGLGRRPGFWVVSLMILIAFSMLLERVSDLLILGKGAFAPTLGAGFVIAVATRGTTPDKRFMPISAVSVAGLVRIALLPGLTPRLPRQFGYGR